MAKQNAATVPAKKKEPLYKTWGWTTRNISQTISILLVGYVSYFCTDVLGMNIGIIGVMLIASKVVDALTDICAGYIVDRTHTRFGKARPYEVFIILQWVTTVLLFTVPNVGRTMQYVYVFIIYVLCNAVCMTALGAADSVYLARAFSTSEGRNTTASITGIVIMVGSIIFSMVFPQFVNSAAGATQAGWVKMSIMLGVPLAAIGILRFFLVKEVVTDESADSSIQQNKENKLSVAESVRLLAKNKYALIVIMLMLITYFINNMGTINTLYFKYIIGDIGMLSFVSMTSFITPIILIFFPLLCNKLGTTKIMRICFALGVIGTAIRTVGGTNFVTIMIGTLAATVSVIPISVLINVYLIDCMDYGEWVTGTRIEGLIASTSNFAGKLGSALASGAVALLAFTGYDGLMDVQPDSAITGIIGMYNVLPLILYIVMFVLSMRYKMDSTRQQMMADLQKKREAQNNE